MAVLKYRNGSTVETLLDTRYTDLLPPHAVTGWSLVNCTAVGFDVTRTGAVVSIIARIKVTSSVAAGKELKVAEGLPVPFASEGGRGSAWANAAHLNGTVYVSAVGELWLQNKGETSLGTSEYVFIEASYPAA